MRGQRTIVQLVYEGVDISREINADLLSFSWTDNASGQADDVSLSLRNSHGLWAGEWYPQKGDAIKATIIVESGEDSRSSIYCGRFEIDELSFSGPPSTMTIKAQSAPQGNDIRNTKRWKPWEDVSLEDVAQSIAESAGLLLVYDVSESFLYDRLDQRRESDLAFLQRVCAEEGFALKVTDEQLVIFSEADYEAKAPVDEIQIGTSRVISWSFGSKAYELVKEARVRYFDAKKGETIERTVEVPPPNPNEDWALMRWFRGGNKGGRGE